MVAVLSRGINAVIQIALALAAITDTSPAAETIKSITEPCPALQGSEELLAKADTQYVMLGEFHGNNEMPMMVADIACLYAEEGRPVTVGLEWYKGNQPAIDAFLISDGSKEAVAAFGDAPVWKNTFKDGRSSEAFVRLMDRLRLMHLAGQVTRVVAIVQIGRGENWNREKAMADNLLAIDRGPNGVVVTLIGNLHSRKGLNKRAAGPSKFTAGYLPAGKTVSLLMRSNGGQSWACYSMDDCGPKEIDKLRTEARAIHFVENRYQHDGLLELGVPVTSSPPARFGLVTSEK